MQCRNRFGMFCFLLLFHLLAMFQHSSQERCESRKINIARRRFDKTSSMIQKALQFFVSAQVLWCFGIAWKYVGMQDDDDDAKSARTHRFMSAIFRMLYWFYRHAAYVRHVRVLISTSMETFCHTVMSEKNVLHIKTILSYELPGLFLDWEMNPWRIHVMMFEKLWAVCRAFDEKFTRMPNADWSKTDALNDWLTVSELWFYFSWHVVARHFYFEDYPNYALMSIAVRMMLWISIWYLIALRFFHSELICICHF